MKNGIGLSSPSPSSELYDLSVLAIAFLFLLVTTGYLPPSTSSCSYTLLVVLLLGVSRAYHGGTPAPLVTVDAAAPVT